MRLKNNIRKILRVTGYLLLAAVLVTLLGTVSLRERRVPCRAIAAHIPDSLDLGFVTGDEVKMLVIKSQGEILGKPLKNINTKKLEKDLMKHPYIREAQAYKDVNGVLHVEVIQRKPVVKVYLRGGSILFIDDRGYLLPFSRKYPVHLLVASGDLSLSGGIGKYRTVEDLPAGHRLRDIYNMALFIEQHPFWQAQTEQLYVTRDGEYRMTPRVGSHAIILGDARDFEKKLRNLYALYTHALNNLGWNIYTEINLKFKNQIVCTRR
jgi:cell division protein FtsQ